MITKDNYQEFFLLYVDNELSATERRAVESWVAENPDLQEEWESLLQCRVSPEETPVFRDKSVLFRQTHDNAIGENNHLDYFLSYIDGELDKKQREMVETFIQTSPSGRIQLEQLRRTVSVPDGAVVFPDKESLYHKEKSRPIILFYRWTAGAAAVLTGVVVLLLLQGRQNRQPAIATKMPVITEAPKTATSDKKDPSAVTLATTAALYPTAGRKQKTARVKGTASSIPAKKEEYRQLATVPEGADKELISRPSIATPEPVNNQGSLLTVAAGNDPKTAAKTNPLTQTARQANIPREQSSFATQALLREDNEKEILAASDAAAPGKSKLRGLFRKVARTFGKTADRDSEGKREVLIGAFQVAVN